VLHVTVEKVIGMIDDKSNGRCLSYSCIHCNTVLGVQIDPRGKSRPRHKPGTDKSASG
jgi:hypothetical protein